MESRKVGDSGAGAGAPLIFRPRTVFLASLLAAGIIAAVGSLGDICLGDECPHVRHVRAYVEEGRRVPYDARFQRERMKPVSFSGTPLWHAGLACLWAVTGTQSQIIAQCYHAGFYALLLVSVYYGARQLWGTAAGNWAWLLAATMPMVCVYSVVLYQDVPGMAVSSLGLLLLWRKKFIWAGVCLAGAYFVKMNMLSYAPWAVVFAAWWAGGTWKRRLLAATGVGLPVAVVFAGDVWWRLTVYGNMIGQMPVIDTIPDMPELIVAALRAGPADYVIWKPYSVYDFKSIVSCAGIAVCVGGVVALFRARDTLSKWLWACAALCLVAFAVVFPLWTGSSQMRYTFPLMLVLIMLSARAAAEWRLRFWLKAVIVSACMLQAVVAVNHVYKVRQISQWDAAGYAWIREHTDKKARIMYPEQVLVNQTERVIVWHWLNPAYFMTEATDDEREALLKFLRVSYIAVPLRRVYNRQEEGAHAGGYEVEFVKGLDAAPYLAKVFENPGFLIYKAIPAPCCDGSEENASSDHKIFSGRVAAHSRAFPEDVCISKLHSQPAAAEHPDKGGLPGAALSHGGGLGRQKIPENVRAGRSILRVSDLFCEGKNKTNEQGAIRGDVAMIFVTVGSSLQPFTRLLNAIDEMAPRLGEPVVMQSGRETVENVARSIGGLGRTGHRGERHFHNVCPQAAGSCGRL